MKQTVPSFYHNFRCTASQCSDNCCIGWEIDIDPQTYDFYRSHTSPITHRLQMQIAHENPPHFLLDKNDRCPFLNEQNLCDIFIHLGEEHLCEICTQHPRFHEWFGDYKESGLGLCCEEAVRLLLSTPESLSFETIETDEPTDNSDFDPELLSSLLNLRSQMFALLQDRSIPLSVRLQKLLLLSVPMQAALDNEDFSALYYAENQIKSIQIPISKASSQQVLLNILSFLQTLEPIDPAWPRRLESLSKHFNLLLSQKEAFLHTLSQRLYEYEHLCVYFLYRYLLKAVWDGDILSRIKFSVLSPLIILLLGMEDFSKNGSFSLSDQILNVKAYSKEIEYCDENLEALLEYSWTNSSLSVSNLLTMINLLLP